MAALALGIAGGVSAQTCPCAGGGTQQVNVQALVNGKTACATRNGETWQEFHAANGAVIDYKRGPNDKTDPSSKVGTWVAGNATRGAQQTVTYNYGPGQVYSYAVCGAAGGPYLFCNVSSKQGIAGVQLIGNGSSVPCP